jgi:shikimate kinase
MTNLIVVNGPIASGKTTTAEALASWGRARGLKAAAVEMDNVINIVRGTDWTRPWTATDWRLAHSLACAIIDRLCEQETALVALSGQFFDAHERQDLVDSLTSRPAIRFVTLEASLDETLRRCAADDGRVLTKDAAFVSRIYAGLNWKDLPADELFLSTEKLSTDEVVDAIVQDVGLR